MSLVHIDSCGDAYSTDELGERFTISASSPVVEALAGRNGSSGIKCSTAAQWFEKAIPPLDEYYAGVAIKPAVISTTSDLIIFKETAIDHVLIRLLADGSIRIVGPGGSDLGTTAAGLILPNEFAYIEARVVIDDSAGIVIVQKDGIEILNETTQDTQNAGTGVINLIRFQGSTDIITFDDLYILNDSGSAVTDTFLGDARIDVSVPIGDGASSAIATVFPASPVTHFDKVDEFPPDADASYVTTFVPDQLDLYTFSALTISPGSETIYGVQLNLYARKDNEGGRQVQGVTRPVATNHNGATGTLTTVYKYLFSLFDLNPETAAAWTEAEKNAAEFGARIL